MSDLTVFNFCRVLLNPKGCIIIFNPIQISTSFQLVPSLSFHFSVISLRDKLPASPHPYLCGMILALPQWTGDWLDCWQKTTFHTAGVDTIMSPPHVCTHQEVRKWCDDSSRGHSDPTGCVHSYLRRSEIIVEEVLTRLCRHVLSQMRHLHARRTGRFICIPVCVSAGLTGEENSSKNILTSVKGQDSIKKNSHKSWTENCR